MKILLKSDVLGINKGELKNQVEMLNNRIVIDLDTNELENENDSENDIDNDDYKCYLYSQSEIKDTFGHLKSSIKIKKESSMA